MTFMDSLFSFRGRHGRLAYLGYAALLLVLGGAGGIAAGMLGAFLVALRQDVASSIMLILFAVAGLVLIVWSYSAIVAKRLHDIGLPATHLIWIIGAPPVLAVLQVVSAGSPTEFLLAVASAVLSWGVVLWLAIMPGQAHPNAYGRPPGAPTVYPSTPAGYPPGHAPYQPQPGPGQAPSSVAAEPPFSSQPRIP